eukprot:2925581-Amphidinium_carterae.1
MSNVHLRSGQAAKALPALVSQNSGRSKAAQTQYAKKAAPSKQSLTAADCMSPTDVSGQK